MKQSLRNRTAAGLLALSFLAASTTVLADSYGDGCAAFRVEVPVASAVATAAVLPNLLNSGKSVRAESSRLLSEAGATIEKAVPPDGICPADCVPGERPRVIFRSEPRSVLGSYQHSDRCGALLEETSQQPLEFERRTFDSADALSTWVEEFARGKGSEGQALYDRCEGKCSPRYEWTIARDGELFVLDTRVVCGHARDRSDNEYELSYGLLWTCSNP